MDQQLPNPPHPLQIQKEKKPKMKSHYNRPETCNLQFQMHSNELEVPNTYPTAANRIEERTRYFTTSRQSTKSGI